MSGKSCICFFFVYDRIWLCIEIYLPETEKFIFTVISVGFLIIHKLTNVAHSLAWCVVQGDRGVIVQSIYLGSCLEMKGVREGDWTNDWSGSDKERLSDWFIAWILGYSQRFDYSFLTHITLLCPQARMERTDIGTLLIPNIKASDAGTYLCVGTNSIGSSEASIKVKVIKGEAYVQRQLLNGGQRTGLSHDRSSLWLDFAVQ